MNAKRTGDWIQTYTGKKFWPLDPRPEDVRIEDIAHSLAMSCRFGGHCLQFYSVAEHSVLVSRNVPERYRLHALLHDASEAYLVDMPSPVKKDLREFRRLEFAVERAIFDRFGLPAVLPDEVHAVDLRILSDEAAQNMAPPPEAWSTQAEPLGVTLHYWEPALAEGMFLDEFERLLALRG